MWRLFAITMAVCAALASRAFAVEPEAGKPVQGLKLTLTSDQDELKMTCVELPDGTKSPVIEPTRLMLTFINTGRIVQKVIAHNLEWGLVRFEVKGPDGESVATVRSELDRMPPEPKESDFPSIDPGRSWAPKWQPRFPGRIGAVHFKLLKPGEYRIKAVYACDESKLRLSDYAEGSWTGTLASNWLVLKVVDAGAEPEKKPENPDATNPNPEAKPVEGGMKVVLESDKKEIHLKAAAGGLEPVEPAKLTITLQNASDKPLKLFTWGFGMRLVSLNVTGPDGESVRVVPLKIKMSLPPAAEADFPTLDGFAGWTLEGQAQFPGPFGASSFNILKPGEYHLSLTYKVDPEDLKRSALAAGCWTGAVTSEEIVVTAVVDSGK